MNLNMQMRHELENLNLRLNQLRLLASDQNSMQNTLKSEVINIERSHAHIQNLFETQILNQTDQELNIPYYVEINKQLRLFSADLNLLKTAHKPQTLTKRINKASDRLSLLLTYCDNLLE
jgi:hypothetical protein